jgi:arylsulfatase A-like enzyme
LNVVLIVADDLGWGELGCYGQKKIPTPNIDQLAAEGTRFTQFYGGAPVCAPSRCVLMTGRHLGHAEIRDNRQAHLAFPEYEEGQYPISADAVTFAQLFQKAGYATGAFGKWGLGPVGSTGDPNRKGFDLFYGYNCQAVAHSYYPEHLWKNHEKVIINNPPVPGRLKVPTGEIRAEDYRGQKYAPYLMIAEAEKFLDAHHQHPFFLYLPFIEPHVSLHPPQASIDRFPQAWDTQVYRGESGYLPHPRPRAAYAAMISDLDSYVGRILQKLRDYQLADNTLVIFTSDNGATHPGSKGSEFHIGGADPKFFNSTAGLKGFKGSVNEGGIRVPFIARLPGKIPANHVDNTPAWLADLFPTLCKATGLKAPSGLDGTDLWAHLTAGAPLKRERPLLWIFPGYRGQVAVRIGDFKVLRQNLLTPHPGSWEVYNLATDPEEQHNLARQFPEIIQQAEEIIRRENGPNEIFPLAIPPG